MTMANNWVATQEYWLKRIREDERMAAKLEAEATERIRKMYEIQYKKVTKKLSDVYAQAKDGKAISRTTLWNYSRWRELEASLSAFVKGGSVIEREAVTECLDQVFENVIGVKVDDLNTAAFTVKIDPRTVINTAWSGERFSTRIWNNRAALAERIRSGMEDMLVQGKGLSDMKAELMREFGVGYQTADTLLRTETNFVMNKAHVQRYKDYGLKKLEWVAKNREIKRCELCREGNGKIYRIYEAPVLPAHPRCGCRWVGVAELKGEEKAVTGEPIETMAERIREEKRKKRLEKERRQT